MTVRQRLEEAEQVALSPYAAMSGASKGREVPLEPCPIRTDFQRDRDRILHCKAFRRLKHKTQCFVSPEGDHYRTRLTHTLEVSQIARTIARALRLNEDLTEAISMGHDLGHTPFGHMGERTLDRLSGGFKHNVQSLRVVTRLEALNLTWEVRDGIVNHPSDGTPATLEGKVVSLADRIAYINHDIDDAQRAGVLAPEDIPADLGHVLGHTHGERIDTMIRDIIEQSDGKNDVLLSGAVGEAMQALRAFMFEAVYKRPGAVREEQRADALLTYLYEHYLSDVTHLPGELWGVWQNESPSVAVCDHVAGMTDRFAVHVFKDLTLPSPMV